MKYRCPKCNRPNLVEIMRSDGAIFHHCPCAYSGAHISSQTKSGTSNFHGAVYEYHQTDAWNAAPFFRNSDPTIPADQKVPTLKRNTFGSVRDLFRSWSEGNTVFTVCFISRF